MKKATQVLFILIFALAILPACNSAARKAKKCDCPRFGQHEPAKLHSGRPG